MQKQLESSDILFVKKVDGSSSEVISDDVIVNLFNKAETLEEIKNIVEKAENRFYASWASVDVRDNSGEKIPIDDIIDTQDVLLKRGGGITDNHSNAIIGRTHAYKVLEHPVAKKIGVLQLNEIYSDNPHDDVVWKEIVDGTRRGSSVAGTKISEKVIVDDDGLMTKQLVGFSQYETASVYDPCNPFALNEVFSVVAKSGDNNKKTNGDVNMAKEVVKKEDVAQEDVKSDEQAKVEKSEVKKENGENIVEDESEESTEFDAVNAIKEISEKLSGLDERLNEIEDKMSGAPEAEDESKAEEEESESKEEDAEKAEESEEEEPKADEEKAEDEKEEEVEKTDVVKKLQDENSDLKAQVAKLTPAGVVKTDRPAEKAIGNKDSKVQDIMKKIKTGNFNWNETVKEMRKIK